MARPDPLFHSLVNRMARTLVRIAQEQGCATFMDLQGYGYTVAQIERYGAAAKAKAAKLAPEIAEAA